MDLLSKKPINALDDASQRNSAPNGIRTSYASLDALKIY
jgi:hypothetical protein